MQPEFTMDTTRWRVAPGGEGAKVDDDPAWALPMQHCKPGIDLGVVDACARIARVGLREAHRRDFALVALGAGREMNGLPDGNDVCLCRLCAYRKGSSGRYGHRHWRFDSGRRAVAS